MIRALKSWHLANQLRERLLLYLERSIRDLIPAGGSELPGRESAPPGIELLLSGLTGLRRLLADRAIQSLEAVCQHDAQARLQEQRPELDIQITQLSTATEAAHSFRLESAESPPPPATLAPGPEQQEIDQHVLNSTRLCHARHDWFYGLQSACYNGALALGHAALGAIALGLDAAAIFATFKAFLGGTEGYTDLILALGTASLCVGLTYSASLKNKWGWAFLACITVAQGWLRAAPLATEWNVSTCLLYVQMVVSIPVLAILADHQLARAAEQLRAALGKLKTARGKSQKRDHLARLGLSRLSLKQQIREAEHDRLSAYQRGEEERATARRPAMEAKAAAYEALVGDLSRELRELRDEIVGATLRQNLPEIHLVAKLLAGYHLDQEEEARKAGRMPGGAFPTNGTATPAGDTAYQRRQAHDFNLPPRALLPGPRTGNGRHHSETP